MDKRYQVFVSSTYSDLKEERQSVMQALMEMDCIPAGMELFPAADEEQWTFIKKVIDDCDYYLIVLGGRYGSISPEGIGYTEQEFDYAVSKGIKVVALVHGSVESLPFGKVDATDDAQAKLKAFRDKVCTGRLVKFWTEAKELPGLTALSLQKTIKMYPAEGWVRSGSLASADAVQQVNSLQAKVIELEKALADQTPDISVPNIASGSDPFTISLSHQETTRSGKRTNKSEFNDTWDGIFKCLAPQVIATKNQSATRRDLGHALGRKHDFYKYAEIDEDQFTTISQQFAALGLIRVFPSPVVGGGTAVFIKLTPTGEKYMRSLLVVNSAPE